MSQIKIDKGNIGDYSNNRVLEWKPIFFAIEFIYRMRRRKHKLLNIPSTRQAIAIPKLISAIYHRKYNLIPDDFIKAAVITTPIEDQEIARKIAFDIIFSDKKKSKLINSSTLDNNLMQIDEENDDDDLMENLIGDIFDSKIDLENFDTEEEINQTLNDLESLGDFVNNFFDKAALSEEPFFSLLSFLQSRGGYSEMLKKGLTELEKVQKFTHKSFIRDINNLSPTDVSSVVNLGWGDDLMDQSKIPWIRIAAQYCMESKDFQSKLSKTLKNDEIGICANTLGYLEKVGMDKSKVEKLANQLIERSENLMEIMEISGVLNYIPDFNIDKILDNSLDKDLATSFHISRQLDKQFNSKLTKELFTKWVSKNSSPKLSELFQAQTNISRWKETVEKKINQIIDDFLSHNGHASYDLEDLSHKLMHYADKADLEFCREVFAGMASKVGMQSLKAAHNQKRLEDALKSLIENQITIDKVEVIDYAKTLKIPEEKILEILGGSFEILKSLFLKNISNFERYNRILKNLKSLTMSQIEDISRIAINNENFAGLAAIGHYDLGKSFKSVSKIGKSAQKLLAESLSAGPGDNLLIQWFMHRRQVPQHLKDFVQNLVKDALIKIALSFISNQRGSGEKGLIPTNQLRMFIEGDDMDLIDIDASIENIIMQGKSLNMITIDDLMVRKTEKGRVSICFLLDISGSMSGMKLAACSIAVMVLIGSLQAEEVAICFFESNTHIVKEFGDKKTLEEVADELLVLSARGGTQVQAALKWGAQQLEETLTETKFCFLLTDCQFSESKDQIVKEMEEYLNQKVKFILGVNTKSYSKNYADWILDTTKGEIVHILNIMDIPKILTDLLDNIG
ncbi:MAG: VWA domain-containing protein [Candidatus Lokiarchaeota archaeon]|nr:VWA domain-containing protein [Candidatus Lokiarchaeota archaeon]MBD3200805.1 VWA domain-containing protein [Candidatus Lokiarchaeota archaeon]